MAGRKALITDKAKREILQIIAETGKFTAVAQKLGISERTIYNERNRDPEFGKECDSAMAQARTALYEQIIDFEMQAALTGYMLYSKPKGEAPNVTYDRTYKVLDPDVRRKFMNQLKRDYLAYKGMMMNKDGVIINNNNNSSASASSEIIGGVNTGDNITTFEMPEELKGVLEKLANEHDTKANP